MPYLVKSHNGYIARENNPGKKAKPVTGFQPRKIENPVREYTPVNHAKPVTGFQPGLLNFSNINKVALGCLLALLASWLPDGQLKGREWIARNPTRADKRPGSFCINIDTGKWSDFATGDRGGDVISLAAYLTGASQGDAAKRLAEYLGVRYD